MIYSKFKSIYFRIKYSAQEGIAYYHDLTKKLSPEQKRVVIYGQGRTGSTLLESLLVSTGYFTEHGELLTTKFGEVKYPLKFIRGMAKSANPNGFIFHLKPYHLYRDRKNSVEPADFLKALQNEGWFIIHLKRENKMRHALSNIIAKKRGSYHKVEDTQEDLHIHVNCDTLIRKIKKRIRIDRIEEQSLEDIEFYEVVYETSLEYSEKHQPTVNKILKQFALDPKRVSSKQRKVYKTPLPSLITNYHDFTECVKRNGFEKYLP